MPPSPPCSARLQPAKGKTPKRQNGSKARSSRTNPPSSLPSTWREDAPRSTSKAIRAPSWWTSTASPKRSSTRPLERVRADPHSFLAYKTLSGRGIRVIAWMEGEVTEENFPAAWQTVNAYYARLTGIAIDRQCKNATRMSVLCHDPEALLRPEASSFHTSGMKPREKPKRGTAVTVTAERAYKIIRAQLEEEGIAYAPGSYNDYVSRCFYHTNRYGVPQVGRRGMGPPDFSRLSARAAAAHRKKLLLAHDGVQHRSPPVPSEKRRKRMIPLIRRPPWRRWRSLSTAI